MDGANHLQKMINGLLDYSRVNTRGKNFEPVNGEIILKRVITNLKVAIEENNASIFYSLLPIVMPDRSQIMQVFQNLIGNAIRFHGEEPPRTHISAGCNENEWTFSVHDNGIGIEPAYKEQVFMIFKRFHGREYPVSAWVYRYARKLLCVTPDESG